MGAASTRGAAGVQHWSHGHVAKRSMAGHWPGFTRRQAASVGVAVTRASRVARRRGRGSDREGRVACVVRACGVTFRTPRAEFPRRRSPGHCVAPAPAGGAGRWAASRPGRAGRIRRRRPRRLCSTTSPAWLAQRRPRIHAAASGLSMFSCSSGVVQEGDPPPLTHRQLGATAGPGWRGRPSDGRPSRPLAAHCPSPFIISLAFLFLFLLPCFSTAAALIISAARLVLLSGPRPRPDARLMLGNDAPPPGGWPGSPAHDTAGAGTQMAGAGVRGKGKGGREQEEGGEEQGGKGKEKRGKGGRRGRRKGLKGNKEEKGGSERGEEGREEKERGGGRERGSERRKEEKERGG